MERPPLPALLLGAAGLLLLLLPLSSSSSSDACGPCEPAACPPLPPRGCQLGETRDACGCCPVCARGEGEPCGGGGAGRGHCAPGMECVKSRKRRKGKAGAAAGGPVVSGVCVCKSRYPVCGSDGVTYSSWQPQGREPRGEGHHPGQQGHLRARWAPALSPWIPPRPAERAGRPLAAQTRQGVCGPRARLIPAAPPVGIPGDKSWGSWRSWDAGRE